MKASEIEPDKSISLLFKGVPGEGKTIAASTFALFGPIWIAYFDKRTPVELYNFWHKMGRPDVLENIEYDSYGSNNAHEYLNKLIQLQQEPGRYVAGVTDSVTSLTSAAVNWSMGFRKAGGKKDKVNPEAVQLIPDWDEYKVETSLVTQALDICKSMPWFNIWTAHPLPSMKIEGGGAGNVEKISKVSHIVSYGNKVGAIVPGAFTEIYHFGRQGGKRSFFTDFAGEDYAKTSYTIPKIIDVQDKFFFEVWRDAINKSFKEVADAALAKASDPFAKIAKNWKIG